jgi:hypothetical protein
MISRPRMSFAGRRESSTVPWDVILNRLDRYLRLCYVSAVLDGLFLAAELTVIALSGSPAARRHQIAEAAKWVADKEPSVILIVVATAAALAAAYFVGVTARSLTFAVLSALVNAVILTRGEIVRWWRGSRRYVGDGEEWVVPSIRHAFEDIRRSARGAWRRARGTTSDRGRGRRAQWTSVLKAIGRSLVQPFLPTAWNAANVWAMLDYTYGAESVNRMLQHHPIKVRVSTDAWRAEPGEREDARQRAESEVSSAAEYCSLWLQRYAPEVAIPARATRFLVLATAALPAILLPRSLRLLGGDLDAIGSLLGPLRLALWVGALLMFIGVLREGPGYAAATFHRFVIVEMADAVRQIKR